MKEFQSNKNTGEKEFKCDQCGKESMLNGITKGFTKVRRNLSVTSVAKYSY